MMADDTESRTEAAPAVSTGERRPAWEEALRRGLLLIFFATWSLPIAWQQTALACVLAYLGYTLWRERRLPRTPLDRPVALFLGALLVSTLACPDLLHSFLGYRKLWLAGGGLAVFVLVRDGEEIERLLTVATCVAAAVAAYAIVQHFTGVDLAKTLVGKESNLDLEDFGGYAGYRVKALHPSAITYAHNLLFPLALVTTWVVSGRLSAARRLLLGLGWTLMVGALMYSLTRGVWLAYGVVLLLGGVLCKGRARLAIAAGTLVCVVVFLSAGAGVRERVASIFDLQANLSNLSRVDTWSGNLAMIRERPLLGWGIGNHKQFREPFYDHYARIDIRSHAHNNFLQVWVDAGLLGLMAFVFLLATILRLGWRAVTAQRGAPLHSLSLGLWLGLVGFLVGGLTQYNWGDAEVALVWWACVGLLMRLLTLGGSVPARHLSAESPPR